VNPYITNIDKFYKEYLNPEYVNKGWAIVNPDKYKNYIDSKITSARIGKKTLAITDIDGSNINTIQHIVYCETKSDYRILKYNSNFLAVKIAEREYDLIKDTEIWAIRKSKNEYNLKLDENPPEFKLILNVLNWKMTKKSYDSIEFF